MPADLVVRMRGIAEEPGSSVVDLGVADGKADGIGGSRGFEMASKRGEVSGRAGTAGCLGGSTCGWASSRCSRGRGGSDGRHGDHVLRKGGRFPSYRIFLVVGDLERKENGRVH